MRVMRGWQSVAEHPELHGGALTIGNFDGVHLGHRQILRELRQHAPAGGACCVVTFEPHPRAVLFPEEAPRRLGRLHDRLEWLRASGIDGVLVLHFDRQLASCSALAFAERLYDVFSFRHIHVGYDFAFGRGREGHGEMLRELGRRLRFSVSESEPFELYGGVVSSSRIRSLIEAADFSLAAKLLGRPYEVSGHVCKGEQRGRRLGFPTANLETDELVHPPAGIYAVWAGVPGKTGIRYDPAVSYLGYRPTFQGRSLILETHLLDQDVDLYHRRLHVCFVQRIREDRSFHDAKALARQIRKDCDAARALLREHAPPAQRG